MLYVQKLKELKLATASMITVSSFKFSFHVHVEMFTAVQQLSEGTLYHLRPKHPVIDAVGYLKVDEQLWLLLIQESLSPYTNHRLKAGDLMSTVTGDEKSYHKEANNWVEYYYCCVRDETERSKLKSMYVYISHKELHNGDPSTLADSSQRSCMKDMYLGLNMNGTGCAKFITREAETVTYQNIN